MPGKPLDKVLRTLRDDGPAEPQRALPIEPIRAQRSLIDPKAFLALIEMMRECERYDFADETLRGIYDTVACKQTVTPAQHAAVLNIRHSVKDWEDLELED